MSDSPLEYILALQLDDSGIDGYEREYRFDAHR